MTLQTLEQELDEILSLENIAPYVGRIETIREKMSELGLSNDGIFYITNRIKSRLQGKALQSIVDNKGFVALYMATGTGKSKVAIDWILSKMSIEFLGGKPKPKFLLVVPTEKLRDENWKDEFQKWGALNIYDEYVERTCYASLHKYELGRWHVILDEGHNITDYNYEFFENNIVESCVVLTATEPNALKKAILTKIGVKARFDISLPLAIQLGISPKYEIVVVTVPLDNKDKYLKVGSVKKGYTDATEVEKFKRLNQIVTASSFSKFSVIARMRFVYELRSKTIAAKQILTNLVPEHIRALIFCGSIEQSIELCPRRYFSKPSCKKTDKKEKREKTARMLAEWEGDAAYNDFKNGLIPRMSCVDAVNEGHNLGDIDLVFIVQLNKQIRDFTQRLGRIRFSPNKIGKAIILIAEGTMDVSWANKAMKGFDVSKIRYVTLEELRTRKEVINFD